MAKRMSIDDVRNNFSSVLAAVHDGKMPVMIEKGGHPLAVLISPEQWEYYQELSKRRFFEVVDEIQHRNQDKDPDEDLRDVTAVVEEVRQQRYEQEHR